MRTIIAGSRKGTNMQHLKDAIAACGWSPTTVISGGALGADKLGENWAKTNSIPCEIYPADWDKHGKSAGYKRNQEMAEKAEALIAIWDGESRGTKHMIDIARIKKMKIFIYLSNKVRSQT